MHKMRTAIYVFLSILIDCGFLLATTKNSQDYHDGALTTVYHHKRRHFRTRSISNNDCSKNGADESTICNRPEGRVCRNKTCVSSCAIRHLQKCNCSVDDDNYCYLCCGDSKHSCLPAHKYHIYQPNGERWERETCTRCHNYLFNGLQCDDREPLRVCYNGKCVMTACQGKKEGSYCDVKKFKICTDGHCRDPCKEHKSQLLTCDCDMWSDDRCQLCCFDPMTKRCENAFRKYGIKNRENRAIHRHGLTCRRGEVCNKFGTCSGAYFRVSLTKFTLIFAIGALLKLSLCFIR